MTLAAVAFVAALVQVREGAPAASGTGVITGTVTSVEATPRPLRRAVVTLNAPEARVARTAITDDGGRFAFTGLPPGRYSLVASKRAWVTTPYGAKSPGRPGRAIPLDAGQRVTTTLALARGAVITGTVLDSTGAVPTFTTLRVMRYSYAANTGERRLTPAPASVSGPDDAGQYRIYGLAPGEYYVAASSGILSFTGGTDLHLTSDVDVQEATKAVEGGPSSVMTDVAQKSVVVSSTFYPGATSPAQATPITVRAGEERSGVDFALQFASAAHVSGAVLGPDGSAAPAGTQVSLTANDPSMPMIGFDGFRSARTGTDGKFEFAQIAPGPYLLIARAALPPAAGSTTPVVYSATMDLDVQSDNIEGLSLTLGDTLTISGSVTYDGSGTPPSLTGLRITLLPARASIGVTVTGGAATVNADGTFTLNGVTPGRYRLNVSLPSPAMPLTVGAAAIAGQDALDGAVDVRQSLANAVITITDRVAELNGKVDGVNGADYTLILFAQNREYWAAPSRRVLTTRTAKDGTFTFHRVPPGEYSLTAVDDVEPGEWYDPSFLQGLEPTAIKITISDGEKKTEDIRIGGG